MAYLVCENLKYIYSAGTPFEAAAMEDISFSVEKGELIGIIGHTGSGKSTLIQHLNGLLKPDDGRVFVDGKDIWSKENKKNIRSVRFAVGLCFQYPEYQIFEETVYKEIAFGPKQMGLSADETDRRITKSIKFVGLGEDILNKSPFDLSGGQKRRVAIASIIAMEPKVLVLDEPCAGLDPRGREDILSLVKSYQQKMGNSVILVSHSMEDVAKICDRVLVMNKGRIAMLAGVDEIFSHSAELKEMGLNVPEITDVFIKLKDSGVNCNTNIYTVEQGIREFQRLKREGNI